MKKYILVVIVVLCVFFISSCSATVFNSQINNNDWSYKLPNNYEIWHINSRKIVCGKRNNENSISTVVGQYVSEFCHNDKYVCLKCIEVSDDLSDANDLADICYYYIIDTLRDEICGPLTEQEYIKEVKSKNVTELSLWIKTKPRPEGAVFS